MFSLVYGGGEGDEVDWAGMIGAGVSMTGIGGVRALRDGPVIEAGDSGSGIGMPSSGPLVEERLGGSARLEVEAEDLMVSSGLGSRSTLLLATLFSGILYLPINFRFASTPNHWLELPFEVNPREVWGLGGGIRPAAARLQAPLPFPPSHFE